MPCYVPLDAYAAPGGISFKRQDSFGIPIQLPCGRCLGCRLEKAKGWALRCYHEAQMHDENSFITLTYRDANLPPFGSLRKSDFQKFIRSLRQKLYTRKHGFRKIRYYMCGEYGATGRAHYHAIIFGYGFPDKTLSNIRNDNRVYRSKLLEDTWLHGTSEIGSVTYKSAGYVARYILKKQNGEQGRDEYSYTDPATGELRELVHPYTQMSLKPGIGESWYHAHKHDLFPHDYAVLPDGRKTPVPAFYRLLLKKEDPDLYEELREQRIEKARQDPNNTPERLAVREACQNSKAERLLRTL